MVGDVRDGQSMRSVAERFGVPLSTVQYWVQRAAGSRFDRVDWEDRLPAPRRTRRIGASLERRLLAIRQKLKRSVLGEYGAAAIRRELLGQHDAEIPSLRTIGRVLVRHGVLDGRRRIRRPPPPKAWYLPVVADRQAELDSFDTIEGLAIRGGPALTILTGISLHGGLPTAWPERKVGAQTVLERLVSHWREFGLPGYAQFDNDNRFAGPRQHPDAVGRVVRLCLSLGVTPVFTAPNETGFQAAIESFNGRWQAKVWSRFQHRSLRGLRERSLRYLIASRLRHAPRIDSAPARHRFGRAWRLDLQANLSGKIVYLRRTDDRGHIQILGHSFPVDRHWVHRLVRAEVLLDEDTIQFFALRRRQPNDQPLLNQVDYTLPKRLFKE